MVDQNKPWDRERRVYFFTCSKRKNKAESYKRRKVRTGLCRKCRHPSLEINPNQQELFAVPASEQKDSI